MAVYYYYKLSFYLYSAPLFGCISGLEVAVDLFGWMMSIVWVLKHASSTAQTVELDQATVAIFKM